MTPIALTIAGSDPSGGAGIQADLKTFHQHGVYGTSVLTLLTVQNTLGVSRVEVLDPALVVQQLEAVLVDVPPLVIKTGALGRAEVVEAVAEALGRLDTPVVVDPVMISKHGAPLLDARAVDALRSVLLPRARLLMPNLHEAEALLGWPVRDLASAREAARALADLGPVGVLVKGGHLEGEPTDVWFEAGELVELRAPRVATDQTHGTGCTYSSAITARLCRGLPMDEAISGAKRWLSAALASAPGVGAGTGPVNHLELATM